MPGRAELVRRRLEGELLDVEGVVGVAHSNPREKVLLLVESEEYVEAMPRALAGVQVEVRVAGKIYALGVLEALLKLRGVAGVLRGLTLDKRAKWRPAPPGVSIGHVKITAGTFGALCYDAETGEPLILSNNHVLAAVNEGKPGDPILQPGRVDGGEYPEDVIGELERFEPIEFGGYNLVDAAVAKPLDSRDVVPDILGVGRVLGVTLAREGLEVVKSGRTTCTTRSRVVALDATVKVCYNLDCTKVALFKNQIVFENPYSTVLAPGDSGSLLVNASFGVAKAVGLCFAGSVGKPRGVGVANPIGNVESLLKVRVASEPTLALGSFGLATLGLGATYFLSRRRE